MVRWVVVLVLVRLSLWGLETGVVSFLVWEEFMSWWRPLSESATDCEKLLVVLIWGKVVLHLRNLVSRDGVLSLWRLRSGPLKGWTESWGRVGLWLSSAAWGMGSVCGKVSPLDATFWVILPWVPVLNWGQLYWLLCSFNTGSVCERFPFPGTSWSLLEQLSGVLLL